MEQIVDRFLMDVVERFLVVQRLVMLLRHVPTTCVFVHQRQRNVHFQIIVEQFLMVVMHSFFVELVMLLKLVVEELLRTRMCVAAHQLLV